MREEEFVRAPQTWRRGSEMQYPYDQKRMSGEIEAAMVRGGSPAARWGWGWGWRIGGSVGDGVDEGNGRGRSRGSCTCGADGSMWNDGGNDRVTGGSNGGNAAGFLGLSRSPCVG